MTVSGNEALGNQGDGGGIYNDRGMLNATSSTIDHNVTSNHGGGLYNDSTSTANLTNVTISNNQASVEGGGIYEEPTIISGDTSAISLINVTLKDNRAGSTGGGFFNANGTSSTNLTVALKNTVLADNAPQNCKGKAFTSAKYSLSTDDTCTLSGTGNQASTPADLFPLGQLWRLRPKLICPARPASAGRTVYPAQIFRYPISAAWPAHSGERRHRRGGTQIV